jgi:hypothetical protein
MTATSGNDGEVTFTNVPYGHYITKIEHNEFHEAADSLITLQQPTETSYLALNPLDSDFDMSLSMRTETNEGDFDYKLYAQNPAQHECECSPENKYCAYAQHFRDSRPGAPSSEIINIRDLAVAKYRTTIEPSPVYAQSCSQSADAASVNYHAGRTGYNWNSVSTAKSLSQVNFNFGGHSGTKSGNKRNRGNSILNLITKH